MSKSKLIIITEQASFLNVKENADIQGFDLLENKGFLKFDNGKLVEVHTLDDAEIVFVWDRYSKTNPEEWWQTVFLPLKKADEKWYIAHHTNGIKKLQSNKTKHIFCREGAHIPGNVVYGTIADILLDTASNKQERIIETVFKIEPVLEFLHGCLDKKPDKADFQKLKDIGIDISLEDAKSFDNECIESLRDQLT